MLGVIWLHWAPHPWKVIPLADGREFSLPFEIGLHFFLTLTGFLTTRVLLRDRDAGEQRLHKPWKRMAMRHFLKRRAVRLLLPCYAAMLFGWICGAPDLRSHLWVYLLQVANFHMAFLPDWPSGTAHYWTLAIQIQFFLLWPLVIFRVRRKAMGPALIAFTLLGPLSRWLLLAFFPQVHHTGTITTAAADYLGIGALLALALEKGMPEGYRPFKFVAWGAFAGWAVLYSLDTLGMPVPGLRYLQQTLLSVAFAGLISSTLRGFTGIRESILVNPAVQHIGRLSYGLYLFHTTVPLALGKVLPWLWWWKGPPQAVLALQFLAFTLGSWAAAWLCWRFLEQPLDRFRHHPRKA